MNRFEAIATAAIEKAKIALGHEHVIDMGTDTNAEGITGYLARQADGAVISGETEAAYTLDYASRDIAKIGRKGKQMNPEAAAALDMIWNAKLELGLID